MVMIAIVPAKWHSSRVPLKNYREFYDGKSLVDILIEKLQKAGIPNDRIYLSCENEDAEEVSQRHGVEFATRSNDLCDNDVPLVDWIRGVAREVDRELYASVMENTQDLDILWAQCIDPLFDEFPQLIQKWEQFGRDYDSCPVVYPRRKYLLDQNKIPIGWGFGHWHIKSQLLPYHYEFNFTASILTRESIRNVGYHIGAKPLWYESDAQSIDIDTEEEFELARAIYAAKMNLSK